MHRRAVVWLSLCSWLALTLPAAPRAWADDAAVAQAIERAGLRALSPTPASDFTLNDITGQRVSLSSLHGHWVLLTFFATWCGPCASEMPSLEALHKSRSAAGLKVVAVAVDGADGNVASYARGKGLTFPILLDNDTQVSATYRASSIPTSYLVSPTGSLVAMSRGAREWAQMTDLFDTLLGQAASTAAPTYASKQAPVPLPSTLVPPDATVTLSDGPYRPGVPFELLVHVRWAGTLRDYILHPPEVHLPTGMVLERTAANTSSATDRTVITYRLRLTAAEAGAYSLDPVELRYTPAGENAPQSTRIAGPTVDIAPPTLFGLSWQRWAMVAGAAAMLGAGGVGARRLWQRRVRAPAELPGTTAALHATLQAQLHEARKLRLEGKLAGFLQILSGVHAQLQSGENLDELHALAEGARYGGQAPADDVLDRLWRSAERRVAALAPDPHKEAEQSIHLAQVSRHDVSRHDVLRPDVLRKEKT